VELSSQIAERLALYREHPSVMVREMFGVEPDAWQEEVLEAFPHSPRIAMQACTGPGKTAVLAWLGWNFLLTRPHPMIGAASISGGNLKSNLWPELARLHGQNKFLQTQFEFTATAIYSREHPHTWRMEARSWAANADASQIGAALKGLHSKYVMWLLDETGAMPQAILPTVEAIFSGDPVEAHIAQAGNPLSRQGLLFASCVKFRKSWKVVEITADPDDPMRTPRVSVEHARQQIEQYGRDDPYVRVNILGKFPPHDINALIGEDEVMASMKRTYREHEYSGAARVLGVDVALEGDDASVIFPRQGIQAFNFTKYRGITPEEGAGAVARKWGDWRADAAFVDNTGGFGSGWMSQLRSLGRAPIGVQFSGEAHQKSLYYNKRSEMYFDAVNWIKEGGALPYAPEILAALTQTTYSFKGDRLLLEPKKLVKVKLGYSPDEADAFVLTFAEPVTPQSVIPYRQRNQREYDPFASINEDARARRPYDREYDPFS
jgi:phage terminase large subunit